MKYLSETLIRSSIEQLRRVHVFFGTTFLVLKSQGAPVGKTMRLALDKANEKFLRLHYRLHPSSDYYFIPLGKKGSPWRKPRYPSTSLQAVNTQMDPSPLLHIKNDQVWGWHPEYITRLSENLLRKRKIPLVALAAWICREYAFEDDASLGDLVNLFISEFGITDEELFALFEGDSMGNAFRDSEIFQGVPVSWQQIAAHFEVPDDVPLDGSARLQYLEFSGLGPVQKLQITPGKRLNLVTGDNGLGKTFLLDVIWWALTQEWASDPIMPVEPDLRNSEVKFLVGKQRTGKPNTVHYSERGWTKPKGNFARTGLVLYARVDGSFSVWDPVSIPEKGPVGGDKIANSFSREQVWDGSNSGIEGLIRDWVRWQSRPDKYGVFNTFEKVLKRMGPPDIGDVEIGEPIRLLGSRKEIPTLRHPYGLVPITQESAGIRRIVALAYLIVWAWEEHKVHAELLGRKEERQMIILIDEAEAHLHPKWQRVLLPALLGISEDLDAQLNIQFFVATHSPMVMASAETIFNDEFDSLYHLGISAAGKVKFSQEKFILQGGSDAWLESDIFGLRFAKSPPAERALNHAIEAMESSDEVSQEELDRITDELAEAVAPDDPIWLRWFMFTANGGGD